MIGGVRRSALAALAVLLTTGVAEPQSLNGQHVSGAFVTMTMGAACPSTITIAYRVQGETGGVFDGVYDGQGSFTLAKDDTSGRVMVSAFSGPFEVNKGQATGTLTMESTEKGRLDLSCDALALRISGRLRYELVTPVTESGIASIEVSASRRAVTSPYFGTVRLAFSTP